MDFGILAAMRCSLRCFLRFFGGFIPSLDKIHSRRRQVELLNDQIEKAQNLKRLQTSNCDKRLCVKVVETQCNYGKKGDRYCVADLK